MNEQDWVEFGEGEEEVTPGVYEVEIAEGEGEESSPSVVRLHFVGGDWSEWTEPDGEPYLNPGATFVRRRRLGDLPE